MKFTKNGLKLNDSVYNCLKWICLTFLPACAFLYGLLADIWGLPYESQITRTISGVALFIGMLIGISQLAINKERREQDEAEGNS